MIGEQKDTERASSKAIEQWSAYLQDWLMLKEGAVGYRHDISDHRPP